MANETMTLISTTTIGASGPSFITFSSLPQTYTDLMLVFSTRSTGNAGSGIAVYGRFNGDTASNYTYRRLYGTGGSTVSDNNSTTYTIFGGSPDQATTSNTFSNVSVYIPNYASAQNKTHSSDSVEENNSATAFTNIIAGRWNSSSAITSITFGDFGGNNFSQYSTASLYGILKGSGGATVS